MPSPPASPSSPEVTVEDVPLTSPEALALIARLNGELDERYPEPGANFFSLDPEEVGPGRGAFVVARLGGVPMGCGAVRLLDAETAEVKRMFVDPSARGHGIGRRILGVLEERARTLGVKRLVLEMGPRQPDAHALYTRAGFVPVEPFGEYVGSPLSVCLARELR